MRRDFCDQTELLARMKACVEPLHEKVACSCVEGFSSKEERDRYLDAEARYEVERSVRTLRTRIGYAAANQFVTEDVLGGQYTKLSF